MSLPRSRPPSRPTRAAALAAALLALLLFGCAAPLAKPEVSVAGVELVDFGVVEQTLLLSLRVVNPNDFALAINALSLDLDVNARAFAHGESTGAVRLAPRASALLEIRVGTRLGELVRVVREARRGEAPLTYHLSGQVDVDGYGRLPFERSAELPRSTLERLPLR